MFHKNFCDFRSIIAFFFIKFEYPGGKQTKSIVFEKMKSLEVLDVFSFPGCRKNSKIDWGYFVCSLSRYQGVSLQIPPPVPPVFAKRELFLEISSKSQIPLFFQNLTRRGVSGVVSPDSNLTKKQFWKPKIAEISGKQTKWVKNLFLSNVPNGA